MKRIDIAALDNIVGAEQVVSDPEALAAFSAAYQGLEATALPLCMVYAVTAEQVRAVVRLAAEWGVGVVPCSSEDAVKLTAASLPSPGTDAILLNLSRMNRIMHIDRRNRVATIEAGVTFAQLEAALEDTPFVLEHPFQARPNKSVVATMLDRDPTTVPMNLWDVNDPLLCLEVVFGDGSLFRTGSAAGPGTLEELWEAGCGLNNSMGPSHTDFARTLSGSQGTLGIVTWASIKLELKPTVSAMRYLEADRIAPVAPVLNQAIRRRLGNDYVILNRFALASVLGEDAASTDALAEKAAPWTVCATYTGKRILPEEKLAYQTQDFADLAQAHGLTVKESVSIADNKTMERMVIGLGNEKLWKLRYAGACLDLFFLTTMDQADRYVAIIEDIVGESWKLAVFIQPSMQARYCQIEFVIPYAEGQEAAARRVYDAAAEALLSAGAFFSRPYGPIVGKVYEKAANHTKNMEKMKDLFDPKRILNPGKLSYQEVR